MARAKTEECPVCGDMFSPQGLSGHLRMAHGVNTVDELREDEGASERDAVVKESQQTITLVDKLSEVGDKREQIEEWDKSGLFVRDEGAKELGEALDKLEKEIRERLAAEEEGEGTEAARETVSLSKKTEQVFKLIDRFVECREKREKIESASVSSTEEATEALDRVERKIRKQLEGITKDRNTSKQTT